jgi:hypothetical protein
MQLMNSCLQLLAAIDRQFLNTTVIGLEKSENAEPIS